MKPIVILGVFVADLTFRNDRMPVKGQTLIGKSFKLGPGAVSYTHLTLPTKA